MLTVALLGNSLALSGIGASLGARPGLRVAQLDPAAALDDALGALAPDVLVFDLAMDRPDVVTLWRLHPGVLPVGIDLLEHRAVVFSWESARVSTTDDLLRVIEGREAPSSRKTPAPARRGPGLRPKNVDTARPPRDETKGERE